MMLLIKYTSILFFIVLLSSDGYSQYPTPYKKSNKWGYKDDYCNKQIKRLFEDARHFSFGLAAVKYKGKWGFINEKGTFIIQPRFEEVGDFDSYCNCAHYKLNGKWGVMDSKGHVMVRHQYDKLSKNWDESYIRVNKSKKWGVVSLKDKMIIPILFDNIGHLKDGIITASIKGKWGIRNTKNKWILPPEYLSITTPDSKSIVRVKKDNSFSLVKLNEKSKNSLNYDSIYPMKPYFVTKQNGKYGLIDSQFETLYVCKFDGIDHISGNFMLVNKNKKWCYIEIGYETCEADKPFLRNPNSKALMEECSQINILNIEACSDSKFKNFIQTNTRYPPLASSNGIEGTATLRIYIDELGNLGDVEVLRDPGGGCAEEFKIAVSKIKHWIPATKNGQSIASQKVVSIKFTLKGRKCH